MPRDYDEKRDFFRVTVDCSLTYRIEEDGAEEEGLAQNLSGRGMMFIAQQELPVGSMLEVHITPETDVTAPLHATVKVVRADKQKRGEGYEIGAIIKQVLD